MKIENLVVQYLYEAKSVTLENIGTFQLSPEVDLLPENDPVSLPPNAINFVYNSNAAQDAGLLDFIVKHTRKIKPLASSDLESYSILTRQFLNIGKPLIIPGLGSLYKTQQGAYAFLQGDALNPKLELSSPASQLKEKESAEVNFSTPPKKTSSNSKKWLAGLITLLVCGAAAVAYYFYDQNKSKHTEEQNAMAADSIAVEKERAKLFTDSVAAKQKADSLQLLTQKTTDSFTFKVVIREYNNKVIAEKALQRYTNFGHKVMMYQVDSTKYKLYIPFKNNLADTSRAKDSLRKFFDAKTYVEF